MRFNSPSRLFLHSTLLLVAFTLLSIPSFAQKSPLKASFVSSDSSFCGSKCISFTDHSVGRPVSWFWTFTGAVPANSTDENPTNVCYNTVGSFDVKLIISDSSGATQTLFKTAYIKSKNCNHIPLKAAFKGSDTSFCNPKCINFTDLSVGNPVSWFWTFSGATTPTSFDENPTNICYNTVGAYDVKLVVSDSTGATQTLYKTAYIKSTDCRVPIKAAFLASDTLLCIGTDSCISFKDYTTGPVDTWSWSFEGGTPASSFDQNPSQICYSKPGIYDVKLVASDVAGDAQTRFKQGYIIVKDCYVAPPVANFTVDKNHFCPGGCVNFTNTSTGATGYSWTFYRGTQSHLSVETNPSKICYDTLGSYFVLLTAVNSQGTPDTAGLWIVVDSCPVLDIPSAFSPNGDKHNDYFRVVGSKITKVQVFIYDRWGQLIYEIKDRGDKWDGNYNGKPEPVGVYAYYLEATMSDGSIVKKKGNVTLLR